MRSSKINYVVVGGFLIAVVVGLAFSLALLTGRTGATDAYYTVYKNVAGIKFGAQVLYEGFPIGQVEEITPVDRDGVLLFRVDFSVKKGWRIPKDSTAEIAASGLLAAVAISISAGTSKVALKPGSAVVGKESASMFAVMSSVATEVGELTEESIKPLLATLERTVSAFGELLEADARTLINDARGLTSELGRRLPEIADNIETFTIRMNKTGEEIQALFTPRNRGKLERFVDSLDKAAGNFSELSGDMKRSLARLDGVLDSVGRTVGTLDTMVVDNKLDIEKSIVDLRYVVESVARHIDAVNQNLEGASRNMYEFSRQIRQNPGLLLGGTPPEDAAAAR